MINKNDIIDSERISISPNPVYRNVSAHEKEETQKEIAKQLKNISRNIFWVSIFIGLGVVAYAYIK